MFLQIFGKITPPKPLAQGYGNFDQTGGKGIVGLISNLLKLVVLGAGLFIIVNIILAGYGIITSNGEPEKISKAQQKIWNSILGMVIIVASFVLAGLLGWILFHDTGAILHLQIYGPGDL